MVYSMFFQGFVYGNHAGHLLPYRDVYTIDAFTFLIYDRIDSDGCFTCLPVGNYQFSLAAPYRYHRIYSLDAGLERLLYGLPLDDTRRGTFDGPVSICSDRAFSVYWDAERVHYSAQERFTHGDL